MSTDEGAIITDYRDDPGSLPVEARKIPVDLDHAWNRLDGITVPVFADGSPVGMDAPACAYPGGADLDAAAYHDEEFQLTWTLSDDGLPDVDLHVLWRGVWIANADELYGCVEGAVAWAVVAAGSAAGDELSVAATFGTPVFTASGGPAADGWTAWAATLPIALSVRDARRGEFVRGWLLEADGHAHPQFG